MLRLVGSADAAAAFLSLDRIIRNRYVVLDRLDAPGVHSG